MSAVGETRGNGELRVEIGSDFDALRAEWSELAPRTGSIFATWEWASLWWRHLGEERPLALASFREADGRLVGIVPFFLASRRPLRVVRLVGRGPGDELGPICEPRDRVRVAAAFRAALAAAPFGWDVLVAENLRADSAWSEIGGVVCLEQIPDPVLEMEGLTWEDFLASRSAKFRQQLKRNERRLSEDHGLQYRLAEDPERLDADLDALFTLHDSRWGEKTSGVFAGGEGALQRDFAKAALERGWLRLWFLELEGEPRAGRLGFRFADVESGYQSGRNRDWDKFGIGFLLQARAIRASIEDGMREYRLLRGGEGYKGRFASADLGLETVAAARGVPGRAALAAGRAVLSLPPERRRWLSRLSGSG